MHVVILVLFCHLADMDAMALVLFHLHLVVVVAVDVFMTSKIYIHITDGVNYGVSYVMIAAVSQRKSQ